MGAVQHNRFSARLISWLILLCVITASLCHSQDVVPIPDDPTPIQLSYSYDLLTPADGLPHYRVAEVIQDSLGFLWIISEGGLARYDGYTFKTFRHDPGNPSSLPDDRVWSKVGFSTYADTQYLWFRSGGQLNHLNLVTERVTRFPLDRPDSLTTHGYATAIAAGDGVVWVSTTEGLDRYDHATGTFKHYPSGVPLSLVHLDKQGAIWLGSQIEARKGELLRFDPESKDTITYDHETSDPDCFYCDVSVEAIIPSEFFGEDYLWIGKCDYGFDLLHKPSPTAQHFFRDTTRYPELAGGPCSEVEFESHWFTPELWMAAYSFGYWVLDLKNGRLSFDTVFLDKDAGLSTNEVLDLFEDRSGVIWLSTWSGLHRLNRFKSAFQTLGAKDPAGPGNKPVTAVYIDSRERLWYGGHGRLGVMDLQTRSFNCVEGIPTGDPELFWNNQVTGIQEDRDGNIWSVGHRGVHAIHEQAVGLRPEHHSPALVVFDVCTDLDGGLWLPGTKTLSVLRSGADSLEVSEITNRIETVLYSRSVGGNWILIGGREIGLVALDLETWGDESWNMKVFEQDPQDPGSLSSNRVYDLYESRDSILWVGTSAGLDYVSLEEGLQDSLEFKHITVDYGLSDPNVLAIIEDRKGGIWIATQNGLNRLDRRTGHIRSYDEGDGLASATFLPGACTIDSTGRLYFGSMKGLISFHPDSLWDNPVIPHIVLTDLQVLHEPVPIRPGRQPPRSEEFCIPGSISYLDTLKLSYRENIFTLEFAALDYRNPMQNQYAYRLEGFDEDWIHRDADNRQVTYTNLDPGEYVFRVKGSNNDGVWNEQGRSLKIVITPPWWHTRLAYGGYIILLFGMLSGMWVFQLSRIRLRHQMELDHLKAERFEELDGLKSRFFANISHEFRTPLTLILGPLEKVRARISNKELKQDLGLMQKHARRVLDLVSQLLDLSKLEAGKLLLHASERNVVPLLKGLVLSFASLAERREITLSFHSDLEEIRAYVDKEALVKIMNNLLSNAFKFTPDGGEIAAEVEVREDSDLSPDGELLLRIADSGIGIPAEQLDSIFDRFSQVDSSEIRAHEGTGIGLALTKELVEMHGGSIVVASTEGEGSVFSIRLPLGRMHLSDEEIVERGDDEDAVPKQEIPEPSEDEARPPTVGSVKTLVLIVEDNSDVRHYIRSYLDADHRCLEAVNGSDGLTQAIEAVPDLIISDIMMPEMDGNELCKAIKSDERTSHIPMILLSAKADLDSKLEGLETGADSYLTKPFEARELQTRVRNLILQRQRLRESFQKELAIVPADMDLSSVDQQFMERLVKLVRENMADPKFRVTALSKQVHMSRQHLNRKLNALTGLSTQGFIRSVRLKQAAVLLGSRKASVSEVAYMVGYNSPTSFANAFKDEFGQSPKQYAKSTTPNSQLY